MEYTSYFHFFETIKSIIHDVSLDFKNSKFTESEFNTEYKLFMDELDSYCFLYESNAFHHVAKSVIKSYVLEANATIGYAVKDRFDKLIMITDDYLHKVL